MSGSFNPIDVGEWSAQVYIGQMEKFFAAIVAQDSAAVADYIKKGIDVNRRDHVGRTPLHVSILSNAVEIACDLIDAGARMTARLVDGRTPLHLAAQMGQLVVIRKLLERNAINAEQDKSGDNLSIGDTVTKSSVHDSDSQDDWSSHQTESDADTLGVRSMDDEDGDDEDEGEDDGGHAKPTSGASRTKAQVNQTEAADVDGVPEDAADEPDILDVNAVDWDFSFTPLMYAIVLGSLAVVEELLSAGADPKIVTAGKDHYSLLLNPLSLTLITENDDRAAEIAKRLLVAGASSSTADSQMMTIFHRAVGTNNTNITSTLLRCDPNANTVLNFPSMVYNTMTFPLITAINNGNYSMLALLLAHGVKFVITEEDISRAKATR
jgi:ankyrin repeat protein